MRTLSKSKDGTQAYITDPETLHIYFTGCGANITFGKYNLADRKKNPPDKRIKRLGERLGKGILSNLQRLEKKEMGKLVLKHAKFEMPLSRTVADAEYSELDKKIRRIITGKKGDDLIPVLAFWPFGAYMVIKKNWKKLRKPCISRLSIGDDVNIVSMPSESAVEYQLYAQSLIPENFLACASYSDGSYLYIPTAKMYKEKGYEPSVSITTPEVEERYKEAIRQLFA